MTAPAGTRKRLLECGRGVPGRASVAFTDVPRSRGRPPSGSA
ncbi:hypothetical protein HMPREF9440_00497 [Sutterella parvirubra YIT 11816]|uniref:Uncharacterized protein n=1 Tax=Sutterella parvirubra YIT 11816 TaxID=762967 RepID=H3KCP4_9BURK|nr:hypothetical protein HMPREF9440_00497 [Sutterella parvirubra YIT 11816]